jgi:putative membrane protein
MERTASRSFWIGLGILALLFFVALPAFGGGMMMGRGLVGPLGIGPFVGFGAPWMWGVWGFGLLIRLAVWAGIILLVVGIFRNRFSAGRPHDGSSDTQELSSEEILRRRYAAGDISREQYEEMRQVLHPSTS